MIAHLYICNRSFRWNGTDQLSNFQMKMAEFQRMMERISSYAEDNLLFLFKDSFQNTHVLEDITISELISDYDRAVKLIGKEALVILHGIMKHCRPTTATIWDLRSYLSLEDEDDFHGAGLVCLPSPLFGEVSEKSTILSC